MRHKLIDFGGKCHGDFKYSAKKMFEDIIDPWRYFMGINKQHLFYCLIV
jgi:hypothetical protein